MIIELKEGEEEGGGEGVWEVVVGLSCLYGDAPLPWEEEGEERGEEGERMGDEEGE